MKKTLCCILAALLAALPCCGVAEGSFYELNIDEAENIASSIEVALSDTARGIVCEMSYNSSYADNMYYTMEINTNEGTYQTSVIMYGSPNMRGIEQLFFSLDFDSYALRDNDYIMELMMLPCWGLHYLEYLTGKSVPESEVDNVWSVILGYVYDGNMNDYYLYELDASHWVGVKFFQPLSEVDPYTGAVYCHVNIK